jgi:hypothetical protein
MKKKILIMALGALTVATMNAQTVNVELSKDNVLLKDQPSGHQNPEDVLNNKLQWKVPNPVHLVYNDKGFDYSKLGKVPAPGIHPRMFTSPSELKIAKQDLNNTRIGKMMLAVADSISGLMRQGKGEWGSDYQKLLKAEINPNETMKLGWKFMNQLTVQALISQMNEDNKAFRETALVASHFIKSMCRYIEQMPVVPGLENMPKEAVYSSASMAKLYDFTASGMTKADRAFYDDFMVKQTKGKYSDGMNLPPHWRRWNHIAMALSCPLALMSVEDEAPVDTRIFKRGAELAQDYYTYQFSPEGMSTEGMNYTLGQSVCNVSYAIAMARRGDKNLFAHPHFRALPDWFIYTMSPNPKALWYTGGDTGSRSLLPWTLVMAMKYFYPNDKRLDYLLANCIPSSLKETPDVLAYLCCNEPSKTAEQYNGVPPVKMPLTYYSPLRGSFITRTAWGKNGMKFSMDARSDTYFISHDHSDRGHFSLSANGREWVVDGFRSTESKYHSIVSIDGRGEGYFATPASWLGFIDNSKATFGIVDTKYCYDWLWLKSPAADLMLGRKVAPKWQNGVYKTIADKLKIYYPGEKPERDPLKNVAEYYSGNMKGNPLIWKEDTWPMRLKYNPVEYAYRTAGVIKGKHNYVLIVDDIKKDDKEHLYEWMMPMPMDVELVSIKQMASVEMQSSPLDLGFNKISGLRKAGEYDMILGDKRMKRDMREVDDAVGAEYRAGAYHPSKGNPQLLIRLLDKTPAPRPNLEENPRLETIEHLKTEDMHQFYLRSMGLGKRLVIPARCIGAPHYKVLLFPYLHGEELPQTEWNADRTELMVKWSDQTDYLTFKVGADGRTRIAIKGDSVIEIK